MSMIGSPEKRWLLAVIVLLTINTGAVLPPYVSAQVPILQRLSSIIALAFNFTFLTFAYNLAPQEKPDLQQLWAVVWTGGVIGIATLWHFLKPPKIEISTHDRRSELLGVLKEEYGQRETGAVLGKSIAPVPLKEPLKRRFTLSIPFLGKPLGFGQEQPISTLDDLLHKFDEAQRQVLILGEPGAGKTTLLVALANRLVQRAIEGDREPIPVILELSAWRAGESLSDWIVAEVAERYRPLPAAQVADWLATGQLLPLLDGLDELKDRQGAAMVTINEWVLQSLKLAGLVVCCRRAEYEAAVAAENVTLDKGLKKQIELQPLDEAIIRTYLHNCKRDFLWEEIEPDRDGFRKLAESPLLLDLMVAAYDQPGKWQPEPPRNPHDLETYYLDCRDRLLDDYFEARLHSISHPKYKPADTRRYLEWLARSMRERNQTEFLIEYMQPDLLGDQRSMHQYCLMIKFIYALILALFGGIIMNWSGACIGLIVGSSFQVESIIKPTEYIDLSLKNIGRAFEKFISHGLPVGIIAGLMMGLTSSLANGLNNGLADGLTIGLIVGLVVGLTEGLINRLRSTKIKRYNKPNQGMIQGIYSACILGAISCLLYFLFWSLFLWARGISFDLFKAASVTFGFSIILELSSDGSVIVQHICLRWFLEKKQYIPRNYGDFLVYASNRLKLLQYSGNRFRFYHDLLRERIAS